MGKLNIQGDLDIHNYLSATNTNLYLSSASSDYSIRFRIGTTEVARISPSGCLNINSTQTSDAYKLYVNGDSCFISPIYLKSTIWVNNSTIGGQIAFLPTRSTDGNATGIINYYASGSTSATDYNLGSFYFTQYSYTDGTYNRLEYWDRFYLPPVAAGKTANNTYKILTSKSAVTVAEGGTGRTTLTSGYALIGNGTSAVSLREITTSVASGSTALVTSGAVYSKCANYLPLSGGAMTGNISYANGSYTNYEMIKFITGNNNGAGIVIGGGGLAVFGGGESASHLVTAASLTGSAEETHITSDGTIYFHTNCQTIANRKTVSINASGAFSGTIAWGNVTGKPSSYKPASHSHSYVPLSGGSMSGQLSISINSSGTSPSTQHIILNGQNGSTAVANAPGLAMHIGNQNWSTLKFLSDGSWRFYNAGCNGYMPIYCSKTVISNYGSKLPSSGATGEVFFKI